jgi:hypothetical protein
VRERLIGLAMLSLGGVLTYFCVFHQLKAASRQSTEVIVWAKGAALCPGLVIMGVVYLMLGKRASDLFGTREEVTPLGYACAVVLGLAGVGLYIWLKSAIEAHGYRF